MAETLPRVVMSGAGAAGLWCALRLVERGLPGSHITLVEPDAKQDNDRTWSYWARTPLLPDELHEAVCDSISLALPGGDLQHFALAPYRYYSIRSAAFYAYAKQQLAEAGCRWVADRVERIVEEPDSAIVYTASGESHRADYVLDSRPLDNYLQPPHPGTLQHFGGWFVESAREVFDPNRAVFMDFLESEDDVQFFYVVPSDARSALIELAVLSNHVWASEEYDRLLQAYINRRYPDDKFDIVERETGVIPMTAAPLWRASTKRIWKVGTAGGWVQPSSGFAFTRTHRFAAEVAERLLSANPKPWRPRWSDRIFNEVMLRYLIDHPERSDKIFLRLFDKNGAPATFAFLDGEASLATVLRVMNNSPRIAFGARFFQAARLMMR